MKAVSIVSIVYGSFGLIWAAVVTILIRVQEVLFENFPWPEELSEIVDLPALLESVYSVIGVLFPFVFLIALLYIISGILQLAGKSSFKNLAYAAAIMNIVWYIAYIVLMQLEIVPVLNSLEFFPKNLMNLIVLFGMLFNAIFYCGYPVFLIIFIRRGGKEWDT
ncbi:MAG: hypothetical protein KAT15_32200, partial [Bacteroidales bacterium]|nr:hypothetical protein [Bacteroidales bacterium]